MKSLLPFVLTLLLAICTNSLRAQTVDDDLTKTILHLDSAFWTAYNKCDVMAMEKFFMTDMEFYHDKGGLTETSKKLIESVKTGLCGNENWRLRREEVAGTVQVFPLKDVGAIISGEHYFYVNEPGKPEHLDGWAKFTHVWRHQNGEWRMHRVLSYDHRPAPADAQKRFAEKQKGQH